MEQMLTTPSLYLNETVILCSILFFLFIGAFFGSKEDKVSRGGGDDWHLISSCEIALPKDNSPDRILKTPFLPKLTSTPSKPVAEISLCCPVCLEDYASFNEYGKQLMSTKCGHLFCDRCIKEIIRMSKSCPKCRTRLATVRSCHPIYL